jgi:hypothetical protein
MFENFGFGSVNPLVTLPAFPTGVNFGKNVTNMDLMFAGFGNFDRVAGATITLPAFPEGFGSSATSMDGMFNDFANGDDGATSITLPDFPAGFGQAATNMQIMFDGFARNAKVGLTSSFSWGQTTFQSKVEVRDMFHDMKFQTNNQKIMVPKGATGMHAFLLNGTGLSSNNIGYNS